jgi:hypothetical protein
MEDKYYKSSFTIHDKQSGYTIVQGEKCQLKDIDVYENKILVNLVNTQNHTLKIPYNLFKDYFMELIMFTPKITK